MQAVVFAVQLSFQFSVYQFMCMQGNRLVRTCSFDKWYANIPNDNPSPLRRIWPQKACSGW